MKAVQMLREMRKQIEAMRYVGPSSRKKRARSITAKPKRALYGETSAEEAEALERGGIELRACLGSPPGRLSLDRSVPSPQAGEGQKGYLRLWRSPSLPSRERERD